MSLHDIDVISLQYFSNFNKVRSLNLLLDTLQLVRLKKNGIFCERKISQSYTSAEIVFLQGVKENTCLQQNVSHLLLFSFNLQSHLASKMVSEPEMGGF